MSTRGVVTEGTFDVDVRNDDDYDGDDGLYDTGDDSWGLFSGSGWHFLGGDDDGFEVYFVDKALKSKRISERATSLLASFKDSLHLVEMGLASQRSSLLGRRSLGERGGGLKALGETILALF